MESLSALYFCYILEHAMHPHIRVTDSPWDATLLAHCRLLQGRREEATSYLLGTATIDGDGDNIIVDRGRDNINCCIDKPDTLSVAARPYLL